MDTSASSSSLDLNALRLKIDSVDNQIVSLLNQRCAISINIGLAKNLAETDNHQNLDHDVHVHIPVRELAVYDKISKLNKGPISDEGMQAIYREIMSASISLQKSITIAFLGPIGTYSHHAAYSRFGDSVTYSEQSSISDVFDAVENGSVTYGVIPFENSTYGTVKITMDRLLTCHKAQIRAESYLKISHSLLSTCQSIGSIKRIYSPQEAFGQCARWLAVNMKGVELIEVSSTAYAAQLASKENDTAAICSVGCASIYGLNVVRNHVEDITTNTTRFLIIGNKSEGPTGDDKTLALFTLDHTNPGALCHTLDVLKLNKINLTKIDSMPSKERNWHYYFFIEVEGHYDEEKLKNAFLGIKSCCMNLRILGSYHNEIPKAKQEMIVDSNKDSN